MRYGKWAPVFGLSMAAWLAAGNAQAQFQYAQPQTNPYGNQTVSPYLNLGRGGNVANNYYNLVRPQFQTQNSILSMQRRQNYFEQQQQTLQRQRQPGQPGGYVTTGHRSYFMNYSHYFPFRRGYATPLSGQGY